MILTRPHGEPIVAREALAPDRLAIEALLSEHIDSSMFLLSNLARDGIGGVALATEGSSLVGVASLSPSGALLLQAPCAASVLARHLGGERQKLRAILGPSLQVDEALAAFRPALALSFRSDEILYALDLDAPLPLPSALASRPAGPEDIERVAQLRAGFRREALGASRPPGGELAEAEQLCASGDTRLLLDGDVVGMAIVNARCRRAVQIGGVYVPPELRGRGYGRAVVAAALSEERRGGALRAVLFTARSNAAARRAYIALGFRAVGQYTLAFIEEDR